MSVDLETPPAGEPAAGVPPALDRRLDRRARLATAALTLALIAANLVAFNVLISSRSTARLDLTEDRQFSIAPVTRRILQSLDDDVIIHGYFSQRTHPKLAPLVPRVHDLLEEFRAVSRGRVRIEQVDPGSDEQAAQAASSRFGVTSTPFRLASKYESGIVNAYFALVVQHGDQYEKYGFEDLIKVDPLPDGDIEVRLADLEYDLTRAIKKVVFGFRSSAELFERVEGPVRLTAIVSAEGVPEVFKDAPAALRAAAEELKQKSQGKFVYEELDPSRDPALQQQVYTRFGVQPMSLGLFGGQGFYLSGILQVGSRAEQLRLTGSDVTQASIREAIEAALRRQTPVFLKTVGVASPRPQLSQELAFRYQMQGMQPPPPQPEFQQVQRFLGQDYRVESVSLEGDVRIPAAVDVLLLLKPRDLSERAVYAIDQYLMRGGRIIVCAGSYETRFDQGISVTPITTGLGPWLEHIGVRVPTELMLDDHNQAIPVPEIRQTVLGPMRTWRMAPYPYLVEVSEQGLAGSTIGKGLRAVGIYWGSPVERDSARTGALKVTEVLRSSPRSWTSSDLSRVGFAEYQVPQTGTRPRALALSLEGSFASYFDGRTPPAAPGDSVTRDAAIERSPETRVMVIGNSEFLSDFVAQALGRTEGGFFAENLRFIENAIDWMTLDSDMITIRSRTAAVRRLQALTPTRRVTLETLNYAIPLAALVAIGSLQWMRRRRVAPVVTRSAGLSSAEPAS